MKSMVSCKKKKRHQQNVTQIAFQNIILYSERGEKSAGIILKISGLFGNFNCEITPTKTKVLFSVN